MLKKKKNSDHFSQKVEEEKKEQGKSLWSEKGIKYFKRAERKWRKVYQDETVMMELYSGFSAWLNKFGRDIIVAKNSTKSLHSVIATRMIKKVSKDDDDKSTDSEKENESDWEEEDGYCSDRGSNRLSLNWSKEEIDRNSPAEDGIRRNNNKRLSDENDDSDHSNSVRRSSLNSSEKRQKVAVRADEGEIGIARRNTTKERVRR